MILERMKGTAVLVACGALLSLAPLSASALGISIVNVSSTGGNPLVLKNGEVVTFDLRLENAGNANVFGLGVGITGFDVGNDGNVNNDNLRLQGGAVAATIFEGVSSSGLDNLRTAPTLIGRPSPFFDPSRIQLFDGVSLTAVNGNGSLDTGVGGNTIGSGDVHFRVAFRALTSLTGNTGPSYTLKFGVGEFGNTAVGAGGTELPFNNATYTLSVIPEPGTALLLGLGLAGLASARGRRA
ncbi:PEP-CTERM sorting domain-containing protein [Myxococcota bacterium]|nr:PEP-CTERM sorting domain-containing protein [Myxococcota bacterium]